jgi:hypothetical protein
MTFEDTIDSVLQDTEVLAALRRRAEETAEWLEHKRWHEEDPEHRGEALLVTGWDEPDRESIEQPASSRFEEEEPVRKRESHPLWAGCTCKSPSIKLIFGEDGDIKNELPQTIETNAYGVAAADSAVSYLGSNPGGAVEYQPGTGVQTPSYNHHGSSNNALYK